MVMWQPKKGDCVVGFLENDELTSPLQLSNIPLFNPNSIKKKKDIVEFERNDNSNLLLRIRNLFLEESTERVNNLYEKKSKKLTNESVKRKKYSNSSDLDLEKDFEIIDKFESLFKSPINFEEWKEKNVIENFYPSSLQEEKQVDNLARNNKYIDSLPTNNHCNLFYPTTTTAKQEKFQLVAEYFEKEYGLKVLSDFPKSFSCIYGFLYIFRKDNDDGNNFVIQSDERIIERSPFVIRLDQETLESFFPNLPTENANIPLTHLKMNSRLFNTLAVQIKLSNSIFRDSFKITLDDDDGDDDEDDGEDDEEDENDDGEDEERGTSKKTKFD
ncbi:predicted protein [Naegleria gruberi]|uniref:Predicted protein n=1 Tax=Naegleria gruberi TaxID=5762 RepID=D2UZ84_NAEGR|nr:uncharacterized protein NAEGRDRAFT_45416 [Naegleria gruberi]EFC49900.1 predicted protein [Naegleria gruberi]|eukprot:XP_002682644.1 predicted protein [Naegleria gruberi strain NEG-M]